MPEHAQQALLVDPDQPATGHSGSPPRDTPQGKHGRMEGGALTDEALSSSRRVLAASRGSTTNLVGLQQWFTPPEAAHLIAAVLGATGYSAPAAVLDPTAGSGALLAPYAPEKRFGIEIDRDYLDRDYYNAIGGDAQKVVPMLRAAGIQFPAITLNPPFGLSWEDSLHAKSQTGSTALAYLWAVDLLQPRGQGAMICGRDRLAREILGRPQAEGIYAVVDVEGPLFDGVALPTSIAFFVHPDNRPDRRYARDKENPGKDPDLFERFSAYRADLEDLATDVRSARNLATNAVFGNADTEELTRGFRAVATEYSRRTTEAKGSADRYDVDLAGGRIAVRLRAYNKLVLAQKRRLREVELLDNQSPAYFGQNQRAFNQLEDAEAEGLLTISPALRQKVASDHAEAERQATPLFPVPPQMRLGWLTDLSKITCTKGDPEYGFVTGEEYQLSTHSRVQEDTEQRTVENRYGEPDVRQFRIQRKLLEVRIGQHRFDEGPENIAYICEHFDLPDPGCVATRHPEDAARNRRVLGEMEEEFGFELKHFQKDHLSRLLVKGRGMLAHEQGLGKSLQQMCLAEAQTRLGAKDQALFVVPQDLIPQWQDQARKFFGRRFEEIRSPAQARDVSRRVAAGETGWWITYFEALSVVGRKKELLPERPLDHRVALAQRLSDYKTGKRRKQGRDPRTVTVSEIEDALGVTTTGPTTRVACPSCGADTSQGWDSESCLKCHYVHRSVYKKTAVSHLTTTFKRGVVCVDEVSEIRGDDSLRSKAVRALARGPHKYGATGTPLSNFINDSYWSLWFSLGDSSTAFPYDYEGGKAKFEADFCVIEHMMGKAENDEANVKKRRKVLPQITNVSQFWRLAQPGVSRCRKEQTGQPLVPRTYHPVRVPMGASQKQAHDFWLENFPDYFAWKFPTHELVKEGLVDKFAAALGQLWRLETAATLPASDAPSRDYPDAREQLGELSNFTPANLKVLELAKEHADKGEKVLIGSDLIMTGKWLAEQLGAKGIKAVHITEEKPDGIGTKNPRKRSREIQQFVEGDAQVLCAGVNAMKLGHDLAVASTVLVSGLPYSWMSLDQFIARVHRLTSEREVSVYVVLPRGSLAERKWSLLRDKGGTSDLAWDGELKVQPEQATDWQKVLKEMKQRGIRASSESDELVDEADVAAAWAKVPVSLPSLATPTSSANGADTRVNGHDSHRNGAAKKATFSRHHRMEEPARYTQPALF